MGIRRGESCRGAAAVVAVLLLANCGGGPSPSPSPTPTPAPAPTPPPTGGTPSPAPTPGATTVTGTERLAWNQAGDTSALRFVAYVNDATVPLESATCAGGGGNAECSAPLPPLADGVHTIAVAAVLRASGQAGPRSESLTVRKVSSPQNAANGPTAVAATMGLVDEPRTGLPASAFLLPPVHLDVVAEGLRAPLQLAQAGDGRLFVADGDARVLILDPGAAAGSTLAFDAQAALSPPPVGPAGITLHPRFSENRFAYLSFLAEETPDESRLHIVRLREVGGVLGEAATIYDAPVVPDRTRAAGEPRQAGDGPAGSGAHAPRLAFGADGLLYALMPLGWSLDDASMASWPHPSVLRLDAEGRRPDAGPLPGITAHPLALAWHPVTSSAWAVFAETASVASARLLDAAAARALDASGPALHLVAPADTSARGLTLHGASPEVVTWATAFMAGTPAAGAGAIRLAAPVLIDPFMTGTPGELGDLVVAGDGAVLAALSRPDLTATGQDGYILRVRLIRD